MYHSVNFSLPDPINPSQYRWEKNSYSDFHLVSDGRPVISMPSPVTNYIEVPGASGRLDMSESLTNYPLYSDREGSLEFIVLNDYGPGETWADRYQYIARHIHGRRLELSLEDDPDYFYEGRFAVSGWESPSDGGNSTISIDYTLDTYKYWQRLVERTISVSGATTSMSFSYDNLTLGTMPTVPTFVVRNVTSDITITVTNPELLIHNTQHVVNHAATYQFQDIVLSDMDRCNSCSVSIAGSGTVDILIRNGDL